MVSAGDTLGAHRVVSLLGAGGMGNVWLAEHTLLQRRVAIKVLRPDLTERADAVERFFDEARAAAQIADPGIVAVHDFGRHAGSAYIVMELLAGDTLATRLARVERLPPIVASRLAMYAAMTMAVSHGHGIVHRDLKPDNLFLVPDAAVGGGERLKILDFGIAKLLAEHDTGSRTQTGAILGTPMYMSPEQCRSSGGVDHRTDIYALGCVLFHMLCGRPPFSGTSSGDLIASHLVDEPPAASTFEPSVSAELDAIVARCLRKDPDERFASMSELARELAPCAKLAIDIATIVPASAPPRRSSAAQVDVVSPEVGLLTTLATSAGEARARPTRTPQRSMLVAIGAIAIVGVFVAIAAVTSGSSNTTVRSSVPSTAPSNASLNPPSNASAGAPMRAGPAAEPVAEPAPRPPPTTTTTTSTTGVTNEPKIRPSTRTAPAATKPPIRTGRPPRPSEPKRPVPSPVPPASGPGRDDGAYELDE